MAKPFSYGYSEAKCESCNDVASYVDNSAAIVRFLFTTACPIDVEKTVGDDGVIKDEKDLNNETDNTPITDNSTTDTTDEKDKETKNPETINPEPSTPDEVVEVTDGESSEDIDDSSTGFVIFITIGGILIFTLVVGFAVWKIVEAFKRNKVKTRPVQMETEIKSNKKSKKGSRSHPDKLSGRGGKGQLEIKE